VDLYAGKKVRGEKKQCVCASIFSIYDMMKIGIFHKKNRKPRIRSYLFFSSYVLFPFSPVRFDFVSSHVCLTAFHGESASVHLVGLTHNDCEEKLNKTCLQHRRAGGDKLMRKSSGGPENDLLGAQLLHSYTDQTTYQEKEYQNDIK